MAYRPTVAEVVSIAQPTVAAAIKARKAFRVGIEVGRGPRSFDTAVGVDAACRRILRHFQACPGFAGVAVHDHLRWRALQDRRQS